MLVERDGISIASGRGRGRLSDFFVAGEGLLIRLLSVSFYVSLGEDTYSAAAALLSSGALGF